MGDVESFEISLNRAQVARLVEIAAWHPGSVTIRNSGRRWLDLDLHGNDGEAFGPMKLPYEVSPATDDFAAVARFLERELEACPPWRLAHRRKLRARLSYAAHHARLPRQEESSGPRVRTPITKAGPLLSDDEVRARARALRWVHRELCLEAHEDRRVVEDMANEYAAEVRARLPK